MHIISHNNTNVNKLFAISNLNGAGVIKLIGYILTPVNLLERLNLQRNQIQTRFIHYLQNKKPERTKRIRRKFFSYQHDLVVLYLKIYFPFSG